jgi:crotonobetainyl-CoA:carnitine CoA-transferase CaiB-like acyl-CoA transferase
VKALEKSVAVPLPFAGVKVIELGTVVAGPFCGSMLADLGAEVLKIEPPDAGDPQRQMGHQKDGVPLWWGVDAREKKCTTINLKHPEGRNLFLKLIASADVLIENYRPGVLRRLNLEWAELSKVNNRLVMLTVTGYGETGPKSPMPGFGKVAEGISGMLPLVGSPLENSVFVGFSLADASSGMFGLFALALALYKRDMLDGGGAHIDLALYEPLMRMLDCRLAVHSRTVAKSGDRNDGHPYAWGVPEPLESRVFPVRCKGDRWIEVVVPDQAVTEKLFVGLGIVPSGELPQVIEAWAAERESVDVMNTLQRFGAEVAPVFDGLSMAMEPYFWARGDILEAPATFGTVCVPGPYPKSPEHITRMSRFRPAKLGADNSDVFAKYVSNPNDIEALKASKAI